MDTPIKNVNKRLTSEQKVEFYIACILKRKQLEDEYYRTENKDLLIRIDKARENIREMMRKIIINNYEIRKYL